MKRATSLRASLLRWVVLPLAVVVAVVAAISWVSTQDTASVVQDRLLLGSARIVAEQLRFEDGAFQLHVPPAALELFQSSQVDRIYYRVTSGSGVVLAGYEDLATPSAALQSEVPHFFNTFVRDEPARAVAYLQPVVGAPDGLPVMVEISQTMRGHAQLARGLWGHALMQQLLILALAAGLIALGLRQGLLPLMRLRERMLARQPGTLQPLNVDAVPSELTPLVAALNDYIRRLESHASAQRVFVQNAAHQLKTPFAVLGTQLAMAARSTELSAKDEAIAALKRTLQQAVRLLNQLLTLSSAEAHTTASAPAAPITALDAMVRQVLEDLAPLAQAHGVDLGYAQGEGQAQVAGSPVALREIALNLVDNAIRYSGPGGVVTVHVGCQRGAAQLKVEDNGPGIAPADHERVFERFTRLDNSRSDGCGLGLAIVREYAQRLGASVSLSGQASGQGLCVKVDFVAPQV